MVMLVAAFALGVLLLGTASLSGHPVLMIVAALLVGGTILLLARKVVIPRLLSRRRQ